MVYALYQIWIIAKNEPTYNKNMIQNEDPSAKNGILRAF